GCSRRRVAAADPLRVARVNAKERWEIIEVPLRVRVRKWGASTLYIVNPALWPALTIKDDQQPKSF
ncbi:MAG: hypothetical protein ACXW3Y_14905, partial [Rhodoplanes sp.]